ncbi:pyruvate kinase [Sphaeroforma arctica JP610]|uniref:Pyruvate kinase n=1 Tax=Sphaeroforma arctica JP610 TaxID=667725 RepID=A0A0L0GAT3_9EUKA|nr:pyruvate kinase [Sphaeroforma arctica JP610]KNC86029.1 pyruvate kinase [Sphaeroforma arctica JP610]|eukprot:XP_014159931.1 pyruvate kinase [Sphaeroforma arctica JP610]
MSTLNPDSTSVLLPPTSSAYFIADAPENMGQNVAAHESTRTGHMVKLNIYSEPDDVRRTSIICTIGPKTGAVDKLTELRRAGMNVMRLNFSHGSYEFHGGLIKNLRESCAKLAGPPVAIALDTKGPEIRTGILKDGDYTVKTGDVIEFMCGNEEYLEKGTPERQYVDYKNFGKVVKEGDIVYIDDGLLSFVVVETGADTVKIKAQNSGLLGSRKGCNLPNVDVDLPALSEKDKSDLRWGVSQKVDMIFASFIRKASDVIEIRKCLGEDGKGIYIIVKIENHEGIRNFAEILEQTDGVMVARGDMGIEVPPEKVFLAQKMMIAMCNLAGKPVICATQMLDSMTYNPRPTRAEVSDVSNAVLDGADCVMLSGETAKGDYPIETVNMMSSICREAECAFDYKVVFDDLKNLTHTNDTREILAMAAVEASFKQPASAILCLTTSGETARLVSKYRPRAPILAVTRDDHISKLMNMFRGVFPLLYPEEHGGDFQDDVDKRIEWALKEAKAANFVKAGQNVVVIQGWKGGSGSTNTLRIINVE